MTSAARSPDAVQDPAQTRIGMSGLLRGALAQATESPRMLKGVAGLAVNRPWRHKSIGRRIEQLAVDRPGQAAVCTRDGTLSYAQLNAAANRLAHALQGAGIGSGDAVLIGLGNTPEALTAVIATVKLGAVAAMLPPDQQGDALAHSVQLVDARVAMTTPEIAAALDASGASGARLTHRWSHGDQPSQAWTPLRQIVADQPADNLQATRQVRLDDPCYYIFTSGTTGLPKASVMTHFRFFAAMAGLGDTIVRLPRGATLYCPLPLNHNNALTVSWGAVLAAGGALGLVPKFSASRFWDDVRAMDARAFCYIGELCRYLLAQPNRPDDADNAIDVMVGNGLRPELWDAFKSRFGIERVAEFYGASEGNLIFVNAFNQDRTAGFCPMPHAVVDFDSEQAEPRRSAKGRLQKVAAGEPGLLVTKVTATARFDGYTDQQASEKKLIRDGFKRGDCWFNTGDLVRQQGFGHIQFVDRLGDTFRWKGENVSTTEVERALNAFDGISEAVVYGVEVPGADGRTGMAAITPGGSDVDLDALLTHLQRCLAPHAVPQYLRLRGQQTATSTFKYKKTDLKDEGFDRSRIDEPLFERVGDRYQRMS